MLDLFKSSNSTINGHFDDLFQQIYFISSHFQFLKAAIRESNLM